MFKWFTSLIKGGLKRKTVWTCPRCQKTIDGQSRFYAATHTNRGGEAVAVCLDCCQIIRKEYGKPAGPIGMLVEFYPAQFADKRHRKIQFLGNPTFAMPENWAEVFNITFA